MAWLRDIGLQFGDIIVKSDNETSIEEFDRVMERRASDEGRFTDDCREQSSGQLEEQSSQCRAWSELLHSSLEETCRVLEVAHSNWPEIAEHAGSLLTRSEVGRQAAYERPNGENR